MATNSTDKIAARGCDRPALKLLNKHVRRHVSSKWHDLGLELLEQEDEETLNEIGTNNPSDVGKCCKEMFQLWLRKYSTATWDQLIQALREVDETTLATKIEGMLRDAASGGTSQLNQQITTSAINQQLQSPLKPDDTEVKIFEINFSAYNDVSNAFDKLFTICQKAIKVSSEEFRTIRNSCVARASEPLRSLIKQATDSHCLFEILADNNKYCNWMNVSFLKVIAIACGNENLQSLIENYTNVIYSKPLREVWDCIPHYSVRDKYYSKLKATFGDKDPDNMTVEELMKSRPQLAKKIAMFIAVVQCNSLLVTWLIPTDELYQAYLSFLTVPHQSRINELVQFGNWMAYLPKNVLQKHEKEINCGAVSIPTLLIGYYHGLLLRDIDADQLTDKMCSTGLLTDHQQTVVSSGHTVHHRNWLLLEYVRQLDLESLLKFCKLLQEEWPEIGTQLIVALDSSSSLSKSQSTTSVLSCCQCDSRSTTNTSIMLVLYFHLIDQLEELLKSYDYEMMMGQCRSLMASDHNDIKLFTVDQLKTFSQYNSAILLRTLCPFTWSNCSVLRSLISHCSKAIKLLHRFESNLDPLQPIACYPIPCLSSDMIPSDTSTYTILAVRCKVELYESSLQYVYDVQSVMIEKCDITQHSLQLLAVRSGPTILYWTIPKCVVDFINTNVPLHSEYLYSRGILEVLVYPDLLLTTGDDVCYGALVFECVDTERDVLNHFLMEAFEELLDERNMLRSELTAKDSLIEEQRKENEDMLILMKKSTEPSRGEMNKASTTEAKLSSKAEYVEKLRKDNERMKIKINQLDEEVNEKNVKMQRLKSEVDQLHHQLVRRHQEPTSVNKISVECQTIKIQQQEEINELSMKLSIKEKENAKLEDDKGQLLMEKQDLTKQLQHVHKKYEAILEENRKLKKDENDLLTSLQTWEQRCKELEERSMKVQEDVEERIKERIANQHSKNKGLKAALDQVIKTINKDAELPVKNDSPVKAEEVVKVTTVVEDWRQLEYETDDVQKLIDHLQLYADKNMDANKQQQNQWTEELDDLNTKLAMKDKEITKLKDERKLLLKSRRESRETSKQPEIKADKGPYPFQYELLGGGNYGEVYKVHYKDKLYAGKVFHSKLLPGHPNVELPKEFTLKCTLASKFSHPNVEQFVEIACADDKGVPMIITELLIENLTTYISRTSDTFHYNLQLSVCNDMAQGLQYLHSQQFVHLNLHGANVLMTPDHHAKIADYLCPLLRTGVALDSTSTAVYQPPESSQHINVQSNVFTLAVLFLQVITKCFPQLEQHNIDLQGVPSCHPLLVFIQRCLSSDVAARPLMREVCDYLAKLLKDKDSTQVMIFKLIHTTEYPPLLPSLTSGRYQLEHIPCQSLPVPMHWAYAVTIETKVYVTGGNSRIGDALEHVFRFDLENNKWDKLLPPSEYHHCVPVVLEGKLSLIGGRIPKSKVVIGMVNTYDEEAKQWVSIYPDMKQPRYRPAVVANDSHVIVLGGKIKERRELTDTIEIMNIKTKQWTMVATTLPDKMYDMSATISNNLVWIIGYDDGSKRSNKIYTVPLDDLIYLTTTKLSWKKLRNDTVCFKTANICYSDPPVILGGDDRQNKTVSAVVAYDPKTESWSEVATLTSPRANCTVVKLPGERGMLVIGGCSETKSISHCNSSCLSSTEIYYCNN